MATWTHYKLVFRLLSPMHIGYRKVGNLMQTRSYVPGKVLWAALTARITRDYHGGSRGSEYKDIGDSVQQYFRFGYLWPSLDGDKPYFPWEHDDFDYLFLGSYASTALNYEQGAADEGLLHEVEFIAPYARRDHYGDSRGKEQARNTQHASAVSKVYLVGDLWVKENVSDKLPNWREAVRTLQLGGERHYGWGRVRCCTDWDEKQEGSGQTVAGYHWNEQNKEQDKKEVVLTLPKDARLTAHAKAVNNGDALSGIAGPIEPLVGWERNNDDNAKNPWKLSSAVVCWAPGGRVKQEIQVQIGDNGIWKLFKRES